MGISTSAAIGLGGQALGMFGKGSESGSATPAQQQSGYASLPTEVKEYMIDTLFPQVQDYAARPYEGIAMRRLREEDYDPIFGSRARQDYQAQLDYQAAMAGLDGAMNQELDDPAYEQAQLEDLENRMIARNMLAKRDPLRMTTSDWSTTEGKLAQMHADGAGLTNEQLSKLGAYYAAQQSGMRNPITGAYATGAPPSEDVTQGYNEAVSEIMIEAARRKGLI